MNACTRDSMFPVFPDDSAWRAVKPCKSITVSLQINQNDSRVNSLKVWQQPERGSTMINSRKVAHGLLETYIMPSPSNFPAHWQRILPRKCSRLKRNRETLMGNRENRPLLSPFDHSKRSPALERYMAERRETWNFEEILTQLSNDRLERSEAYEFSFQPMRTWNWKRWASYCKIVLQ